MSPTCREGKTEDWSQTAKTESIKQRGLNFQWQGHPFCKKKKKMFWATWFIQIWCLNTYLFSCGVCTHFCWKDGSIFPAVFSFSFSPAVKIYFTKSLCNKRQNMIKYYQWVWMESQYIDRDTEKGVSVHVCVCMHVHVHARVHACACTCTIVTSKDSSSEAWAM